MHSQFAWLLGVKRAPCSADLAFSSLPASCIRHAPLHPAVLQELVKAGLLLSLFGGVRKAAVVADGVPVRGDVHLLVVGDPGLGKSQLLQATANAAPRGELA
jgi:hypothetical protein